jgi:hypothetical protein
LSIDADMSRIVSIPTQISGSASTIVDDLSMCRFGKLSELQKGVDDGKSFGVEQGVPNWHA